jgi:hypothetical protein
MQEFCRPEQRLPEKCVGQLSGQTFGLGGLCHVLRNGKYVAGTAAGKPRCGSSSFAPGIAGRPSPFPKAPRCFRYETLE